MAELLLCDTKCWLSGQGASWAWLTITNPSPTLLLGSTGRLPLRRYHSLYTLHARSRIGGSSDVGKFERLVRALPSPPPLRHRCRRH